MITIDPAGTRICDVAQQSNLVWKISALRERRTSWCVKLICVMITVALPLALFAQAPGGQAVTPDYKKAPTPPSPNVSALGKFGDIPVSPSTGIPDISIPFYTYSDQQKNLYLDVSLRYHAGGHKVEDMASNVGLGWALNAGGAIMRTMKGVPDDQTYGYVRTPPLPLFNTTQFDSRLSEPGVGAPIGTGVCQENAQTEFLNIRWMAENTYDGEADIFTISAGAINEKFFFDKNGEVVFMTPNNLKVIPSRNASGQLTFGSFTVIDAKGVSYIFDVAESTQSDNAWEPSVPAPPVYTSAWYLSRIESADKQDVIQFIYQSTMDLWYESALSITYITPHKQTNVGEVLEPVEIRSSANINHTYNAQRIEKIVLPDKTEILFDYALTRQDYTNDKALTSINIVSGANHKLFRLSYDYFVSPVCYIDQTPCPLPPGSPNNWQKRLKLTSIREESGSTVLPAYTFEYYETIGLPYRNSKDQDWWGFYNGGTVGAIIPHQLPYEPLASFLGYDRVPSLEHCKAWILEKITYPTGGNTTIEYELNEGVADGVIKPIGGLRVKNKNDHDPLTNSTYTTRYRYEKPDGTTSGLLLTIPVYTAYWNTMEEYVWTDISTKVKTFYLNETLNPTQTLSYFNGSPVIYTHVKEEQSVNNMDNGHKTYEFTPGDPMVVHDATYPFVQKQDFTWGRGLLLKTEIFKSGNILIRSDSNEYAVNTSGPLMSNLTRRNLVVGNYFWNKDGTPTRYLYGAKWYYLGTGRSELTKTTTREYLTDGDYLQTITEYTYDGTYYLPKLTRTTDSKGRTRETKTYYPFDYQIGIMNSLVAANRVAEVVSLEDWLIDSQGPRVRSITVNEFETVNTNMVKNTKISALETDQPIELSPFVNTTLYRSSAIKEKVHVEAFDPRGRSVQFKYDGNEQQSLIWGDNNQFPIASVVNAAFNDVAFTSFETVEKGNWQYEGFPIDGAAPTGKKIYPVYSGNVSKNSLDPNKDYVISLWRSGGSITIANATLSSTGPTVNGWVYEEYSVNDNATSVTISGPGFIDELRLFPRNARMTSYTYTGLNVTSVSDPNGVINYYEYDGFNRLTMIRDAKRNIVKKVDYHYKKP